MYVCDMHKSPAENCPRRWGVHAIQGTWGSEIIDELKPFQGDIVVRKAYNDGFYRSSLEDQLIKFGISHTILMGVLTSYCVRATAEAALNRDFQVTVIEDCIADESSELHKAGLMLMRTLGVEIVSIDSILAK
jgi:nicotinamidase-related amidase